MRVRFTSLYILVFYMVLSSRPTVTVRTAIYRVQDKLDIESRQEIVVWAVRNGLLGPPTKARASRAPQSQSSR